MTDLGYKITKYSMITLTVLGMIFYLYLWFVVFKTLYIFIGLGFLYYYLAPKKK